MHRTKHLSTTSSVLTSRTGPTNEAKAGGVSGPPSGPDTEDQDGGQTNPGRSARHDIILAYYNAMLHHFGLHAYSIPSGEIEDERILEVREEDLAEEDPVAEDSTDVPIADEKETKEYIKPILIGAINSAAERREDEMMSNISVLEGPSVDTLSM